MNITELKSWVFLMPLVAVSIGWILNSLSQWFKLYRDDKKALNFILFNLIRTYSVCVKINKKNLESGLKKLYKSIPQIAEGIEEFVPFISQMLISTQIKSTFNDELNSIKDKFDEAITDLSKTHPFIAFHLSNSGVKSTLDTLENLGGEIKLEMEKIAPPGENVPDLSTFLKLPLIEHSVSDLYKDIMYISDKISFITKFKSKKLLKSFNQNWDEDALNQASLIFEKLIADLEASFVSHTA